MSNKALNLSVKRNYNYFFGDDSKPEETRNEFTQNVRNKYHMLKKKDNKLSVVKRKPFGFPHCTTRNIGHKKIFHQRNKYHSNPILTLLAMTDISPYNDEIKVISLLPFNIYYWSLAQDTYYEEYSQHNRVILSLDASRNFVQGVGPTPRVEIISSRNIFLYSGVMYDELNNSSMPIVQMLSDTHTSHNLSEWIQNWIDKKKSPNEIVLAQSPVLITAAVKAVSSFNSTADYLKNSFDNLEAQVCTPNDTFIRVDVDYIINTLYNLSCFKNVDEQVKTFYFKCFLLIRSIEHYDSLKDIISDIITVCLNKYDGEGTRCEKSMLNLKLLLANIQTSEIDEKLLYQKPEDSDMALKLDDEINTDFRKLLSIIPSWYISKIKHESYFISLDNKTLTCENFFYMPSLIQPLTKLVSQLPLWSNIMVPVYKSTIRNPSSAIAKDSFKTLRKYLFKVLRTTKRLRIDDFVRRHLEFIAKELGKM